jgi:hypothetical protein
MHDDVAQALNTEGVADTGRTALSRLIRETRTEPTVRSRFFDNACRRLPQKSRQDEP